MKAKLNKDVCGPVTSARAGTIVEVEESGSLLGVGYYDVWVGNYFIGIVKEGDFTRVES